MSIIHYKLLDQFDIPLKNNIKWNEKFVGFASDYGNQETWGIPVANGVADVNPRFLEDQVGSQTRVYDIPQTTWPKEIGGVLSDTKVYHLSQEFRVGSADSGHGWLVQTDNLQYYIDHGRPENIVHVAGINFD